MDDFLLRPAALRRSMPTPTGYDERLIDYYLQLGEAYDAVAASYSARAITSRTFAEQAVLRRLLRPLQGHHVLDVGCGTGLALELDPGFSGYLGIDPSEGMVYQAQGTYPRAAFLQIPLEGLHGAKLQPTRFTAAIALSGAYNCAPLPDLFLDTLTELLEPDSPVLLVNEAPGRVNRHDSNVPPDVPFHLHRAATTLNWLRQLGYTDIRLNGLCVLLQKPASMPRNLYSLLLWLELRAIGRLPGAWDRALYHIVTARTPCQ